MTWGFSVLFTQKKVCEHLKSFCHLNAFCCDFRADETIIIVD